MALDKLTKDFPDIGETEEETCPQCEGALVVTGHRGKRLHSRCQKCGIATMLIRD